MHSMQDINARLFGRATRWIRGWVGMLIVLAMVGAGTPAQASLVEYYVGVDHQRTFTSGAYSGLTNPNLGRLTFLYAHPSETNPSTSHYHSIGAWSYSGPSANPMVNTTNTNNRIPETSSGQGPLPLVAGNGANAGRWVSQPIPGLEYSDLHWRSTQSLSHAPLGTTEHYLFSSSNGRWAAPLNNVNLALELVNISPGLGIMDHQGGPILSAIGQTHVLGDGNLFSFRPTFFTDTHASSPLTASFRLHDLNGRLRESGTFHMQFMPTPVPAAVWLMATGLAGAALLRRRGMI